MSRTSGPADGRGPVIRDRRGPAVRQLRRATGHLPRRGRRGSAAGRGPPMLGIAVDRSRRLLPGHPADRSSHRPAGRRGPGHGAVRDGGGAVHRQPRHRAPARGRHRREPRARRGGGVRRRHPRPPGGRHRDRPHSGQPRRAEGSRDPGAARWRHPADHRGRDRPAVPDRRTDPRAGQDRGHRRTALWRPAGHRMGVRPGREAVADPGPPDHHALPAARRKGTREICGST